MFELGQKVRLGEDEGLDLPSEHQGKVGLVVGVVDEPYPQSYFVRMSNGEEISCAYYHIEPTKFRGLSEIAAIRHSSRFNNLANWIFGCTCCGPCLHEHNRFQEWLWNNAFLISLIYHAWKFVGLPLYEP